MKKIAVIFIIIGIMVVGAYLYVRYSINTPGFIPAQARDTTEITKPAETLLDIKPKLVEIRVTSRISHWNIIPIHFYIPNAKG